MAKINQIEALITCNNSGDKGRFRSIALQIAADYARKGHSSASDRIKDAIGKQTHTPGLSLPPNLSGLLHCVYSSASLSDMILSEETREDIDMIISEQHARETLLSHGLEPIRKILLVGPPGTGKTMTAGVLANTLQIPLFRIKLDGLISQYLGQTAAKLGLIFEFIKSNRAVYFFDEFDAIGAKREGGHDVAEMRRILNSFLIMLEDDQSESLIVSATNLHEIIDRALFRRFDSVIKFWGPAEVDVSDLIQGALKNFKLDQPISSSVIAQASGLSHSEVVSGCKRAAKDSILKGLDSVKISDLLAAISQRKRFRA